MRRQIKLLSLAICVSCVLVLPVHTAEMTPFDKYFPAGTVAYFGLDYEKYKTGLDSTQVDEMLENASMKGYIQSFNTWWNENVSKDSKPSVEALPFMQGRAAFGAEFTLDQSAETIEKGIQLRFSFVADDKDGKNFKDFVKFIQKSADEDDNILFEKKEKEGAEAYTLTMPKEEEISAACALKDGIAAFSLGINLKGEEFIDGFLAGGVKGNLTTASAHQKSLSIKQKDSFIHTWLDMPTITETGTKVLEKAGVLTEDNKKADAIIAKLGLKNFGVFSADTAFDNGEVKSKSILRYVGKPKGLIDVFTRPMGTELLKYIPQNNVMFYGFGHAPMKEIVMLGLDVASEFSEKEPEAMYQEMLDNFSRDTELDLEADIFDLLGSGFSFASLEPGYAVIFELKDGEAMEQTIDAMLSKHEKLPFQPATHEGFKYRSMPMSPLPGIQPCFGIIDKAFVISTSSNAWRLMADTFGSGEDVSKKEWVQKEVLPSGKKPCFLVYYDANGYINMMNHQTDISNTIMALSGNPAVTGTAERLEIKFPDGAYPEGGSFYWTDQGLESRYASTGMVATYIGVMHSVRQAVENFKQAQRTADRARRHEERAAQDNQVGTGDPDKDLDGLSAALEDYFSDNGEYPETLDALVPDYVAAIPPDPNGDGPYRYYSNKIVYFILAANGPDGDVDVGVRTYRGGFKNDRAVRGKIVGEGADTADGDIVRFGPSF